MMADPIASMSSEDFVQYVIRCMNREERRIFYRKVTTLTTKERIEKSGIVRRLNLSKYMSKITSNK